MRKALGSMMGVLMLSAVLAAPALAQTSPAAPGQMTQGTGVPNVSSLTPFTADTDYMSLAGYLRYVSYDQTGQWLTYAEATRMVGQQQGQ